MGPKRTDRKVLQQMAAPRTIAAEELVKLQDLSTADDSGWRAIDRARVDELKAAFERGEFGQNLLRRPSVVQFGGARLLCADGGMRLVDGKQTVVALKEMLAVREACDDDTCDALMWSAPLHAVLDDGLPVSVLEFSEWDEDPGRGSGPRLGVRARGPGTGPASQSPSGRG